MLYLNKTLVLWSVVVVSVIGCWVLSIPRRLVMYPGNFGCLPNKNDRMKAVHDFTHKYVKYEKPTSLCSPLHERFPSLAYGPCTPIIHTHLPLSRLSDVVNVETPSLSVNLLCPIGWQLLLRHVQWANSRSLLAVTASGSLEHNQFLLI